MAIINNDSISKFNDADELINFLVLNRYEPENRDILETNKFELLPDYIRYVILIADFDTEYEMQGIFTTIENSIGHYLSDIAFSFTQTGNNEIAKYIIDILKALSDYNLSPDKLRNAKAGKYKEFDIVKGNSLDNEELINRIDEIDSKLGPLIYEKTHWDHIINFVANRLAERS